MSVKPIPDGYHTLTPFFTVRDAARAIEFYKQAFGAEQRGVMKGPDGKVMHAELKIGDSIVMLATNSPSSVRFLLNPVEERAWDCTSTSQMLMSLSTER